MTTVKEFNEIFYPKYTKTLSFINCFENALQKCDDNTFKQMKIIGWDNETKSFLIEAIKKLLEDKRQECNMDLYETHKLIDEFQNKLDLHLIDLIEVDKNQMKNNFNYICKAFLKKLGTYQIGDYKTDRR